MRLAMRLILRTCQATPPPRPHPTPQQRHLPRARLRATRPDHQEAPLPERDDQDLRRSREGPHAPPRPGQPGALPHHQRDRRVSAVPLARSSRPRAEHAGQVRGYIRRNIILALRDVPLRKLDTETLDRFYAHLRPYGRRCRVCWARAGRPGAGVPDRPWRRSRCSADGGSRRRSQADRRFARGRAIIMRWQCRVGGVRWAVLSGGCDD
jgi:hypothetical protein